MEPIFPSHSAWFPCQPQTLRQYNLSNGSTADLIDSSTHTWKPGLVRLLYPSPTSSEILRLPISKTGSRLGQLAWKYSFSSEYQVKQAYNLISKDNLIQSLNQWHLICKVQVPVKIANFVWRLCHDSLPTFLALKTKGIHVDSSCPLCGEDRNLPLICCFSIPLPRSFGMAHPWLSIHLISGMFLHSNGLGKFS